MKNPIFVAILAGAFLIAASIVGGALLLRQPKPMTLQEQVAASVIDHNAIRIENAKIGLECARVFTNLFKSDSGRLPESLDEMVVDQSAKDPTIVKELSEDPWGSQYNYEKDGDTFRVWSNGPDRESGTFDDIEN